MPAQLVVLVSCDPSSFAKDARRLVDAGYALDRWTVVDLFPLTSHIETVAAFVTQPVGDPAARLEPPMPVLILRQAGSAVTVS